MTDSSGPLPWDVWGGYTTRATSSAEKQLEEVLTLDTLTELRKRFPIPDPAPRVIHYGGWKFIVNPLLPSGTLLVGSDIAMMLELEADKNAAYLDEEERHL